MGIHRSRMPSHLVVAVSLLCFLAVADAAPVFNGTTSANDPEIEAKWKHYAVFSAFEEAPTPKSKCGLKCTAEALAVYWACAGACIAKQAPNACILDGCPLAVTAFDVPCLKTCKDNSTETPPVKVSPPCHFMEPDAGGGCKEATTTDACDMDWEKSGTCSSVGSTVCCKGNMDIELWFKTGSVCEKVGPHPGLFSNCTT